MSYISLKTSSHKGNAPWLEIIKYKLGIKLNYHESKDDKLMGADYKTSSLNS